MGYVEIDMGTGEEIKQEEIPTPHPTIREIPEEDRPWRMLWYQTGPYKAYYYTGRYNDVITLATNALANMAEPVLEESYYWRGLAREALGIDGYISDFRRTIELNSNFTPGYEALARLGVTP